MKNPALEAGGVKAVHQEEHRCAAVNTAAQPPLQAPALALTRCAACGAPSFTPVCDDCRIDELALDWRRSQGYEP